MTASRAESAPQAGGLVDDRDRRAGLRCAGLVWRRDGIDGVLKILTHDLWLFGEIIPRVLAGCLLGGFIAEILPHDKVPGRWDRTSG